MCRWLAAIVWQHSSSPRYPFPSLKQPHSIVQRRLLEGNITRLRGEARDASARVRSPLADTKDGQADAEERSESTAEDSTEERESPEESERSLRSDEEDDSSEAAARPVAQKTQGTESSAPLAALVVQCKVRAPFPVCRVKNRMKEGAKRQRDSSLGEAGGRTTHARREKKAAHISVCKGAPTPFHLSAESLEALGLIGIIGAS